MIHRSPLRMSARSWQMLGNIAIATLGQTPRYRRAANLGDLNTIDLRQTIIDTANAQGVPPSIPLAVASAESGIQQWTPNGNLVTSSAGAIGVMQLMPATAAQLGVDPTDPVQNIQGGVTYLAQMYAQFGTWPLALAAYNWGPDKLQRALNAGRQIPSSVQGYVNSVLATAGMVYSQPAYSTSSAANGTSTGGNGYDLTGPPTSDLPSAASNPIVVAGVVVGTVLVINFLFDR